jgi:Domain of unknown function (DUF5615)
VRFLLDHDVDAAVGRMLRRHRHECLTASQVGLATATDDALTVWAAVGKSTLAEIGDVARSTESLAGVRRSAPKGLAEWRYHGRLVVRQLDDTHLVIRADFGYRDSILRQFPETFSVPGQYVKHMMVVADLQRGDADAIEDAIEAAWQLQRSAD